jgi:mannose-6-phosphate isomerase-like protein (cupin superfamily)
MSSRRKFLFSFAAIALAAKKVFANGAGTIQGQDLRREPRGEGVKYVTLSGDKHGFDALSLLLSEIDPGGGPPLHMHDSEEVHVVYEGTMTYFVGGSTFSVSAPFVQHIPAKTPHAFINSGSEKITNTAIFSSRIFEAKVIGPNPLIAKK